MDIFASSKVNYFLYCPRELKLWYKPFYFRLGLSLPIRYFEFDLYCRNFPLQLKSSTCTDLFRSLRAQKVLNTFVHRNFSLMAKKVMSNLQKLLTSISFLTIKSPPSVIIWVSMFALVLLLIDPSLYCTYVVKRT